MTELIISSTVLIIVVLTLRHFLKRRISLRLQYAIWALVLLRLIVPFNLIQSPISVLNAVQRGETVVTISEPDAQESAQRELINTTNAPDHTSLHMNAVPQTHKTSLTWGQMLSFVWYAGIAVVGLCMLLSNLSFYRKLRKTRIEFPVNGYKPKVYVVENLPSPCLYGIFSPAVYITPDVAEDKTRLCHVLTHELCHYRHGNHIWSALRSLCLAVYWFNPFVWLAASVASRDAELACDESAIRRLGEENRMEYGRTLIGLTCQKRSAMDMFCCASCMTDSKKGIQERIALIAKKPKTAVCTLAAVLLILAVAAGCTFTGAKPGEAASAGSPSVESADSTEKSGAAASASTVRYTVYDGMKPLSKEELQKATQLTVINVDSLDFLRDAPNLTHIRASSYSATTIEDAETVSGDINALSGLTNLQSIRLANSNVTGDISALSGLEQLQELSLSDTHVSGELSALNKLTKLRVMHLAENVTGDLDALNGMPALEILALNGSGIKGSLSALGGLQNLHNLSLYLTPNVTGNISMIKEMHLNGIQFIETGIAIDLSDLSVISDLYSVELASDNMTGDLSALSGMSDLISINLSGKNIEGDLSTLGEIKNLLSIYLISTPNITGDISALKACEKMTNIYLDDTSITVDLSNLSEFSALTYLTVISSNVSGDLSDLNTLRELAYIRLSSPNITGDIKTLGSLYNLNRLRLNCPSVTGNMDALGNLKKLTYIDLSTANVTGDIGALTNLKLLKHLDLSSTDVSGDIAALAGLANLSEINLNDTNVTGNITN